VAQRADPATHKQQRAEESDQEEHHGYRIYHPGGRVDGNVNRSHTNLAQVAAVDEG
jgi:hypothetical protein